MGGKMSSNGNHPPKKDTPMKDMGMGGNISSDHPPPPKKDMGAVSFNVASGGIINIFPNEEAKTQTKEIIKDPSPSPADRVRLRSDSKKEASSDPSPSPSKLVPRVYSSYDNIRKKETETCRDTTPTLRPRIGVFTDFGKQARDVLNKDYYNSYSHPNNKKKKTFFALGASSSHAGGSDLSVTAYPRRGGFSIGEFSAAANNSAAEIKTNAELNGFSTNILFEIVPKTIHGFVSMEYPDLNGSSKVGVQYLYPYGTLTAATSTSTTFRNSFSTFHYSATIGYRHLSMGGGLVISSDPNASILSGRSPISCADIKDYSVGIRFMNSDFDATVGFTDKGDSLSASCVRYLDAMKKSCAVAEFKRNLSTNENTLMIGGSMEGIRKKKTTLLKAKMDNHGKMGVVLQQQLFKDTKIRICGEFDSKDLNKTPMIGMSFIL